MDWRTRQAPTNSVFQSARGRGRGRGRARGGSNGRGGHATQPIDFQMSEVAFTPSSSQTPPAHTPTNLSSFQTHSSSHQGSHQRPLRVPSLPQIDDAKLATNFTPPRVARRASHTIIHTTSTLSEPLNAATPNSPRPKPARKRPHNRTRSSSKMSVPGQLSTAISITPLSEKGKDKDFTPPESVVSSNAENQTLGLRTDIDMLVERVRAMAMAGSAIERDKGKRGHKVSGDGHFDWAGDEDDTLPDLDDWVRPKSTEPRESDRAETQGPSGKLTLPTVVEVLSPRVQTQDVQLTERGSSQPSLSQEKTTVDTLGRKPTDGIRNDQDHVPGKVKTRGRHTKGKNPASDANKGPKPRPLPLDPGTLSKGVHPPNKPLVHPLPAKPQLNVCSSTVRPPKTLQPASGSVTSISEPLPQTSQVSPNVQVSQEIGGIAEGNMSDSLARSVTSIDGASAPSLSDISGTQTIDNSLCDPSSTSESVSHRQSRMRAFDTSVDWASAPSNEHPRRRDSHSRSSGFSSLSVKHESAGGCGRPDLPHTALPLENARGPFSSPQLSPSYIPLIQTRSQRNSPERTQRVRNEAAFTHHRAHSSPQTGQGSRTSRPIITVDGLSIISRTLGAKGVNAPPRGQTAEVSTVEVSATD